MADEQLVRSLREALSSRDRLAADPFGVLKGIASIVAEDEAAPMASEFVLRALEARDAFAKYQPILNTLARHTGHFPYVDPGELGERDQVAYEFHRPVAMDDEIVFHRVQAQVYRYLLDGDNVVLSAPTSFGKSKLIDAMIATERFTNVAVIVPTLALIDETRRRLSRFRDKYKVVTHVSQRPADRNLFVLTAERALAYSDMPSIDFFVIDEFYKLGHYSDGDRMVALNSAFYRLRKGGGQFYLLGPNIERLPKDADGQLNARVVVTNFTTVISEQTRVDTGGPDQETLIELCRALAQPTIIYCSSPKRVNEVAAALVDAGVGDDTPGLQPVVDWASAEFHPDWVLCKGLARGIGIHHGRLPRSLAQYVVQLFNEEKIGILICTSTLIEGVNTKAKNVVIYDNAIARQKIDFFTFNNIKGRSGRMFEHFIGHVYLFSDPPQEELPFVDLPLLTQDGQSPTSLLVQIDNDDLKPPAALRVQPFLDQEVLSMAVIRENTAVDPQSQVDLANALVELATVDAQKLAWTGMPQYKQLEFACELIWQYLVSQGRLHGVSSGRQLTFLTWQLQRNNSVSDRVLEALKPSRYAAQSPDEAVERVLQFDRSWAGFELPRLLMALSRIQVHVLSSRGIPTGNYAFYSTQLEACFRPPIVGALDEYGIPPSLGEKLVPVLGITDDLDLALDQLRSIDLNSLSVEPFEFEVLQAVLPSL